MTNATRINEFLAHYGIIGMHWGIRQGRRTGKRTASSDYTRSRKLMKKKISEMSNEELKTVSSRLQLEKNYKDLNKSRVSKGKAAVGKVIGKFASKAANDVANTAATNAVAYVFKNAASKKG